ncbi:MAG: hypothetical protein KAQ77_14280, partial [Candidatus Heimdallarchaeota archaeon]|nr:hypothetical protein [Candidatus Heimdallarchaeota archaeon]
ASCSRIALPDNLLDYRDFSLDDKVYSELDDRKVLCILLVVLSSSLFSLEFPIKAPVIIVLKVSSKVIHCTFNLTT